MVGIINDHLFFLFFFLLFNYIVHKGERDEA